MSYNVRDDNATLGPNAAVEIPNGASASFLGNLQLVEAVGMFGQDAATLINGHVYTVFVSPPAPTAASGLLPLGSQYRVVGGTIYYATATAGAATLAIEICAPGVANGSGTNVLSTATTSLQTAATTTPVPLTLNTSVSSLNLAPNSRINFTVGGAATTGLVDLACILYVARTA